MSPLTPTAALPGATRPFRGQRTVPEWWGAALTLRRRGSRGCSSRALASAQCAVVRGQRHLTPTQPCLLQDARSGSPRDGWPPHATVSATDVDHEDQEANHGPSPGNADKYCGTFSSPRDRATGRQDSRAHGAGPSHAVP